MDVGEGEAREEDVVAGSEGFEMPGCGGEVAHFYEGVGNVDA